MVERDLILEKFNKNYLIHILKAGKKMDNLEFLEGIERHNLIENFSNFYMNRFITFKNGNHIFDEEPNIQKQLSKIELKENKKEFANHQFCQSNISEGIQLSDIITGILGKMYSYISISSIDKVEADYISSCTRSKSNLALINKLLTISHDENIAFIQHVKSLYHHEKINKLLN